MIGIICAMTEETKSIEKIMENKLEYKIYKMKITIGKINKKQIVLITSGIGTINATIATTLLLNQFDIKLIVNLGTVGACLPELSVGDLVIPNSCVYLDVDVTEFGYSYGQIPKMPSVFALKKHYYEHIKKNLEEENKIFQGTLGTSNKFIKEYSEVEKLNNLLNNKLSIIDMEGCAIAQTCFLANIDFVAIKVVSDLIQKDQNNNAEQFNNFIDHASFHYKKTLLYLLDYL